MKSKKINPQKKFKPITAVLGLYYKLKLRNAEQKLQRYQRMLDCLNIYTFGDLYKS